MSKNPIHKLIASIVNRLSQGSVKEVEDGITSSAEMASLCRNAVAEGCVLLKNEGVLPLADKKFALFGRCQVNTFYVGYGSGGDVKPPYRVSILDGLDNRRIGSAFSTGWIRAAQISTKRSQNAIDNGQKSIRPTTGIGGIGPCVMTKCP